MSFWNFKISTIIYSKTNREALQFEDEVDARPRKSLKLKAVSQRQILPLTVPARPMHINKLIHHWIYFKTLNFPSSKS